MKSEMFTRTGLALLAWAFAVGASASDFRFNQCNMSTNNNSQTMTYLLRLGDYYIARDAPIGAPIGTPFYGKTALDPSGLSVTCNRNAFENPSLPNPEFVSEVIALGRPYTGILPNIAGRNVNGKVFHTSVPGVGIAIEFTNPYFGPSAGNFTPPTRLAPFRATNYFPNQSTGPTMSSLGALALLVKIADIDPGTHTIAPDILFQASMMPNVPKAFTVAATGTIRQAQCTLSPTNPVSADPVDLGTWSTDDFTGPRSYTDARPFSINLQDCESNAGPDHLGYATAHVTLTGTNGSAVIEKDIGLFSLDAAATAKGVGIQMLLGDGTTPVKLGEAFPVVRIPASGNVSMALSARLYQLPDGTPVRAGITSGAMNFTVNYL